MYFRKTLLTLSTAALFGTMGLAAISQPAAARVVCSRAGDCWSTNTRYRYPRNLGVRVYSDRYANPAYRQQHWRDNGRTYRDEHHDRGYYKSGIWVQF